MSNGIITRAEDLHTTDGLEAEVSIPSTADVAAVLCHPHPLHGGNMRSLVPSELFRLLPAAGFAVLRFNFRGVEGSEGTHGGGSGEHLDIEAAIATLAPLVPGARLVLVGWSFGADVSLTVTDDRVAGWVAVAPPLRVVDPAAMTASSDPRPKLLVIPEHDQFDPPDRARAETLSWRSTTIETIGGADHFLVGRTDRVAELVVRFGQELLTPG
jgi:alpha/beta superfamily hydrolase